MADEDDKPPVRHLRDAMLPEPLGHIVQMIERLTEQVSASEAETRRRFDFVIDQQAQLSSTVERMAAKIDRTADGMVALRGIAEIQSAEISDLAESMRAVRDSVQTVDARQREADERGRQTDERLNALIGVVERLISDRRAEG